ncbi:helix-turn-helix domain-containing protein, partial [Nocardia abscessus]|uniref:helix-turn-helix domain-containing protein n=1 Tax=Nocardia abscessus TaxID=120957 RepID=UPI0024578FEB
MVLGHIPEGDPEAMRRAADAWSDAANALVPVVQRLQAASAQLEKAVEGAAGAAMQEQYRKTIAHTEAQIEFCNSMARPLYDNATAVDEQLYIIYYIGLALALQVLVDMTLPPPGSLLKIIADRLDAKAKMQIAQSGFAVAQLTRAVRFQQAHPAVMLASKGVFFGTAVGGGAPYLAQRRLIEEGHLKKVDWQKVKIGAAAGAVGGLVGVEVGRRFAPAAIQAGGRVLGTVAAGGVGGMAGGLAGGMTAWWLTDGALRGKDLAAMVWTGFGSGLVGSVGAAVRAGRMGAYTGAPEPVAAPDSGLASDSAAPMARVSAPGDGQPPQTHTATPELTATTSEGAPPPAEHPESMIRDGHADWEMPDGLKEAGDRLLLEVLDSAEGSDLAVLEAFFRGPDSPGPLSDGSGGITPPRNAPDHPSGGSPHPAPAASSGRGGPFPAWGDTAVAQTSAAVIAPPDGGTATPLPNRQAQISDPQVRPDQRGVGVITEGTIAQPDASAPSAEMLMDGTSAFVIEHGPGGEMRLVTAPEQTVNNTSENSTGFRPTGETLDEGAVPREEQSLLDLDFEAGLARLEAELAGNPQPANVDTAAPSVNTPAKAADVTPSPPIATDNTGSHANTASVPEATPPVHAGNATQISGPSTGVPRADASPIGTPPTTPDPKNVVPQTSTAKGPEAARSAPPSTPEATNAGPHTGSPKSPTGSTPPPGAHSTAPYTAPLAAAAFLSGHTPDAHDPTTPTSAPPTPTPATGFLTTDPGESPQTAATPPDPVAATSRPGTDDEPDADPEEFPTPPGTVVDDPRDHNVWKDPREHSVWEDPRDHSVQKKPAGDYVTIPGVSYPLEDEPPADAIPVIPRLPASAPLPVDSVGLGRAFQNPDNPENTDGPASPRPPDIVNPLSDRHPAAPGTNLDAGLDKPPAAPVLPTRYATAPNPEAPGAPQQPAAPQLNPHSLEYNEDPSRLPAVGGLPPFQTAPQPKPRAERKRLVTQMGGDPAGNSKRRRKKTPSEPPPPPPKPTPPPAPTPDAPASTPEASAPTPQPAAPTPQSAPRPKPAKRSQPSTPQLHIEFVVRRAGEAIGAVGDEGERVAAVHDARRFVRSLPLSDDQIEIADLLVSETVANALRWTEGKVAVIVTATDTDDTRKIRFTVTDESQVVPERTGMPDWDAERGRGGEFVVMMSDAHGTTVHEDGKATWFELHQPRGDNPDSAGPEATPSGGHPGAPDAVPIPAESEAAHAHPDRDHSPEADNNIRAIPDEQLGNPRDGQPPRPVVQAQVAPKQYPGTPDDALDVPPGSIARGDGGQMVIAPYTKGLPIEGPLAFHTPPGEVPGAGRRGKPDEGSQAPQVASEGDADQTDPPGTHGLSPDPADPGFRKIGDWLKTVRDERGLTTQELADRMGRNKEAPRHAERGRRITAEYLRDFAAALDIPLRTMRSAAVRFEPHLADHFLDDDPDPTDPRYQSMGHWLRANRQHNGLSLREVGERINRAHNNVWAAENDKSITPDYLRGFAVAFEILDDTLLAAIDRFEPQLADHFLEEDPNPADRRYRSTGDWYKANRKRHGLSLRELADSMNYHPSSVSAVENGGGITADYRRAFGEALGIPGETLELVEQYFSIHDPNDPELQSMGGWLKSIREHRGLTQPELADRIGYSTATLGMAENNHRLTAGFLRDFAETLGISDDTIRSAVVRFEPRLAKHFLPPKPDPTDPEFLTIGDWLRADRQRHGWTQRELAERMGRAANSVQLAESGAAVTPEYLREVSTALGIPADTMLAAVRRFQPQLTDHFLAAMPDPADPRYRVIGDWLKANRQRHGWTQKELGDRMGWASRTVLRAENGGAVTPEYLAAFGAAVGIPEDTVRAAAERFTPPDPTDPRYQTFGAWLKATREHRGWTRTQLADRSGRDIMTLRNAENNHRQMRPYALRDFATALGISNAVMRSAVQRFQPELEDFFGTALPALDTYPSSIGDLLTAIRQHYGLPQRELAARMDRNSRTVVDVENGGTVTINFLRTMREALNLPHDYVRSIAEHFLSPEYQPGESPEDRLEEASFWDLFDTAPGSPEELAIQNKLLLQYLWIAKAAAWKWRTLTELPESQSRDDLMQIFALAIRNAIPNHVPGGPPFIAHAWRSARGVMLTIYFESLFPLLDRPTRLQVIRVYTHVNRRQKEDRNAKPRNGEIAQALGLTPAEVSFARQTIAVKFPSFDDTPYGQDRTLDVADPNATPDAETTPASAKTADATLATIDREFAERISQALSNLPNADVATRLVELVFLQSVSLEEAIDELNEEADFELQLGTATAQEILAQASSMLRTVFDPPDSVDQDDQDEGGGCRPPPPPHGGGG